MPKNEKPPFGKRNLPEKPTKLSGHEALPLPLLTIQTLDDTFHEIKTGEFHPDLHKAIQEHGDIKAMVGTILGMYAQQVDLTIITDALHQLTKRFNEVRGKK